MARKWTKHLFGNRRITCMLETKKKMLRFDKFSFERSQDSRRTAFTEVQITSQAQINSAPDEGEPH